MTDTAGTRSPRTGRTAISAHAAVRVEAAVGGGVRVAELRSEVPLVLRRTGPGTGPAGPAPSGAAWAPPAAAGLPRLAAMPDLPTVTVHLVNAAAGPLAGDDLHLDITVGAGVRLVLGSVAATVALPGRSDAASVLRITAEVADGGALDLVGEPTVAARGCRHRIEADVTVGAEAFLRWREEILLGRFGEPAGSVSTSLRVDVVDLVDVVDVVDVVGGSGGSGYPAGSASSGGSGGSGDLGSRPGQVADRRSRRRPLLRQELDLSPDAPGLHGPAVLGGARAVGSLLVAAPGPPGLGYEPSVTDGVAVLPLAGPGVLISALADDAVTLRRRLTTTTPSHVSGPVAHEQSS